MATASKKTVARAGRRTKAEVEKEFASVQAEVERARQEANPKNEESRLLHEAEVRAAVEAVTVEGVVQRISSLGLDVSKALGGLSEQLREGRAAGGSAGGRRNRDQGTRKAPQARRGGDRPGPVRPLCAA